MRLVLWDIDGTLLDSGGVGRDAFAVAFERVVGRPARTLAWMAGRTDHQIALETLELNGVEGGEALWPDFAGALADALRETEPAIRERGRPMPGAHEAIAALAVAERTVQSVLTGNIKANAAVKLGAFGLDEQLDLEAGAYGSDDGERPALVAIARGRAGARHGFVPAGEDTVLVGDTPLDVAAGRAGGARVVAVATGPHRADELADAGADTVLSGLGDTDALVEAVLGRQRAQAS